MGKTSKRRPCLISRKEEDLRWDLVLGKITIAQFYTGMDNLGGKVVTHGTCGCCKDGLMVDANCNYGITCRIDLTVQHRWHTCKKFQEDV